MQGTDDDEFDWVAWRRDVRRSLVETRRALPEADRLQRNAAIDGWLAAGFDPLGGATVAFCWPIACEPEPRFAVRRWREAGSRACLPVMLGRGRPLEFRAWWPGAPMATGQWGIEYPDGTDRLEPDAALIPVNGFDEGGFRLGYGGGYFDRTLADEARRPICIGLAYETARMRTIYPCPHDVPMDYVVTERGIHARMGGRLEPIDPATARERIRAQLEGVYESG